MYHYSIETVRECISRQTVVTDDLRKFERELGPEGLIHVTRLQSAFGTYVVGIEPAPSGKLCGHCGGAMPIGRSCDCFDNHCQ